MGPLTFVSGDEQVASQALKNVELQWGC